jgi:dipeptidyl aminopeptidase/acylaminoacyl peptidase
VRSNTPYVFAAVMLWLLGSSVAPASGQTRSNGKIAFSLTEPSSDSQIYLVNEDGSGLTKVPGLCCGSQTYLNWSPDGTKLVFASNIPDGNTEIYKMNADGSGRTRLTNTPGFDEYPSWSPNGTQIAFFSDRDFGNHVYVMNADGSDPRRITPAGVGGTQPAWSPDGKRIAFSTFPAGVGNSEIFVINADGTGLKNLTNNPGNDYRPSWSPDGSKIAFSSLRNSEQSIYVMNADGTGQTRLSFVASDNAPSWSPDGAKIVFSSISLATKNDDLYVMNADGSNVFRLTNSPIHDSFPAWQPKLAPTFSPTLITEPGTNDALALDSVTLTRGPFSTTNPNNLGADQGTRLALFAVYTELLPGEGASAVTAQAEDSQQRIYPLTVEYVGQVPGMIWLTQVNVRLPKGLAGAGEVMVSISLRGTASSKARVQVN